MKPIRWSDHDRYFGPFTYAAKERGSRMWVLMLSSGDGDDYPGCRLRISLFRKTLILSLPPIIKPVELKQYEIAEREYGISLSENFLQVKWGIQPDGYQKGRKDPQWSIFLPWTEWKHVRHSLYDAGGEWFMDTEQNSKLATTASDWRKERERIDACPTRTYAFEDYDGEILTAKTRIEEREWTRGVGSFAWLRWFWPNKVARSLDIQFSGETGKKKGSWKGGTIGHGTDIPVRRGVIPEGHDAAFRRYCREHSMTFLHEVLTFNANGAMVTEHMLLRAMAWAMPWAGDDLKSGGSIAASPAMVAAIEAAKPLFTRDTRVVKDGESRVKHSNMLNLTLDILPQAPKDYLAIHSCGAPIVVITNAAVPVGY